MWVSQNITLLHSAFLDFIPVYIFRFIFRYFTSLVSLVSNAGAPWIRPSFAILRMAKFSASCATLKSTVRKATATAVRVLYRLSWPRAYPRLTLKIGFSTGFSAYFC